MSTYHLATIFDKNYLAKAVALHESALEHVPGMHFWFFCLDAESEAILRRMNPVRASVISVDAMGDAELLQTKAQRTRGEFAFTAKSAVIAYMFSSKDLLADDIILFCDADMLFYSSAAGFLEHMKATCSIGIVPHRFSDKERSREALVGKYNAGMIFLKNDANARQCVQEWRKQCIEWCYQRYEDGKFADQKYMDEWQAKYKNVCAISHKGVNLGSWNIRNHKITSRDSDFYIDIDPLILYHFHGIKLYLDKASWVKIYPVTDLHTGIYAHYADSIARAYARIREVDGTFISGFDPKPGFLRILKQTIQRMF